jgi:hypothetical protein
MEAQFSASGFKARHRIETPRFSTFDSANLRAIRTKLMDDGLRPCLAPLSLHGKWFL